MLRDHDPRSSGVERSPAEQFEPRELDRGSRGGSDPREVLPRDPRDVFTRGLALPRGNRRQRITVRDRTYELRGSDVRLMATVGAFRAVPLRDLETAEMAIQAALTGHLVLSTLHTNDAPSAITRLMDLGVPPYLIFHDATLREMAVRKPASRAEFAMLSGVGQAKLAKYGDAFLAALQPGE